MQTPFHLLGVAQQYPVTTLPVHRVGLVIATCMFLHVNIFTGAHGVLLEGISCFLEGQVEVVVGDVRNE